MQAITALFTEMAAVAATAAFAMDLSASIRTGLDVAEFTSNKVYDAGVGDYITVNNLTALKPTTTKDENFFQFSASGERVGATIKLRGLSGNGGVEFNAAQIWFKPFEALKVTAGTGCGVGGNGNPCSWEPIFQSNGDPAGIQLDVSVSGLSVTAGFNPGFNTALLSSVTSGNTTTNKMNGSVYGKISYALPFGSVYGAVAGGTNNIRSSWRASKMGGSWGNPNYKVGFGAGFSGNFDPLSVIVDFAGFINNADKFDDVTFDVGVKFASGDFSVAAFVPATIWLDEAVTENKVAVGYEVKATYAIAGLTAYIDSWSGDVLGYAEAVPGSNRTAKLANRINVKPGVSGKFGDLMDWDVAVELGFAGTNNFQVKVPVTFTVSF